MSESASFKGKIVIEDGGYAIVAEVPTNLICVDAKGKECGVKVTSHKGKFLLRCDTSDYPATITETTSSPYFL